MTTSRKHEIASTVGNAVSCEARPFPFLGSAASGLSQLYKTPSFLLEWDNDLPFHLARNLVHLRRLRDISQAELADRMGTSQAKIARIEGGEENVTLRTIKKIADALQGRVTLTLQPSEMQLPRLPSWWDYPANAAAAWGNDVPTFKSMLTIQGETGATIGARWDTGSAGSDVTIEETTAPLIGQISENTLTYTVEAVTDSPESRAETVAVLTGDRLAAD